MNRLRSVVFSAICILVFGCILIIKGLEHSPLSSAVSSICKETSQLEGRNYELFPKPSISAVTDGSFQSSFEQYVADSTPLRDQALLVNAGLQRTAIACANQVFRYSCYPTFFGSRWSYVPSHDAVIQTLSTLSPNHLGSMERAASSINALADSHKDVSFYLLALDRPDVSDANPTTGYVSNPLTYTVLDENLYGKLSPAITVSRHPYLDEDNLFGSLYRTDHHWHTSTAYDCYANQVMLMDPSFAPATVDNRISYDSIDFFGSCSRTGLCVPKSPDHIDDVVIDTSSYKVTIGDNEYAGDALAHRDAYLNGNVNSDVFTNRYAEYFHGDWGLWRIDNPAAQTGRSLLIVRDSYGGCMERFFAANYAHVYVIDFRNTDATVTQLLEEHQDIDTVLVLMGWNNIVSEAGIAGLTP